MIHSNFTAELHCKYGQVGAVNWPFGHSPLDSTAEDGWLCAQRTYSEAKAFEPLRLRFRFIEQVNERTHYKIYCEEGFSFKGARLDQSRGGWLGLYGAFVVGRLIDSLNPIGAAELNSTIWKIQALEAWDGSVEGAEGLPLHLRDGLGFRVALAKAKPGSKSRFLHAGEGDAEVLTFQLRNIQLA